MKVASATVSAVKTERRTFRRKLRSIILSRYIPDSPLSEPAAREPA